MHGSPLRCVRLSLFLDKPCSICFLPWVGKIINIVLFRRKSFGCLTCVMIYVIRFYPPRLSGISIAPAVGQRCYHASRYIGGNNRSSVVLNRGILATIKHRYNMCCPQKLMGKIKTTTCETTKGNQHRKKHNQLE